MTSDDATVSGRDDIVPGDDVDFHKKQVKEKNGCCSCQNVVSENWTCSGNIKQNGKRKNIDQFCFKFSFF